MSQALGLMLCLCLLLASCSKPGEQLYQGYVEGEFVYVASQLSGRLDELAVRRGDRVSPGQRLFALERQYEEEGVTKATASLEKAKHTLDDVRKGLRPEELKQIESKIERSQSLVDLARLEYERKLKLIKQEAISQNEFDQAKSTYLAEQANQRDFIAQLQTGKLGSRIDQVLAALSQVNQSQNELDQAVWSLDQKVVKSTLAALVFDLLHYQGEMVSSMSPVLTLLPPGNVKVRFFVPERVAGGLKIGQEVTVNCDGCPAPYQAKVSFVSPVVEYSPPVIFSQDFREKLVIMIEARPAPEIAAGLNPGQPVDVRVASGAK